MRTLVLNQDMTPHATAKAQKAFVGTIKNQYNRRIGYETISYFPGRFFMDTQGREHPVPAVVRSVQYIKKRGSAVPLNKKNVNIRDNYCCQYCGNQFESKDLTYDHVIPRCQWNKKTTATNWYNIVSACVGCNHKKGGRTPEQAGMKLIKKPIEPRVAFTVAGLDPYMKVPREWLPYLLPVFKNIKTED